jgi:membrane dipeptidase
MRRLPLVVLVLLVLALSGGASGTAQAPARGGQDLDARAAALHKDAIVVDTHIDTTAMLMRLGWRFEERHAPPSPTANGRNQGNHVDLPRMREGGFDAAFFSIYIPGTITGPEGVARARAQIARVREVALSLPNHLALCTTADDVRKAHAAGKIGVLLGVEGGHMINEDLGVLRQFARLGVRYLTLTHTVNTPWAGSSLGTPATNGLTPFGRDVVRELNRLGVLVDISHVSDQTFKDALEASEAPLIASHSSCRAICGHVRNMTDDMIKALAAKGGVIQINYYTEYLDQRLFEEQEKRRPAFDKLREELEQKYPGPQNDAKRTAELQAAVAEAVGSLPPVSWERIVEHIDHAVKIAGADHVGLGSDFDGATMPVGMEDCSKLPNITRALLERGYSEADIRKILGGNTLRLLEEARRVSIRLAGRKSG